MRPYEERPKDYKDWADDELIDEARGLHASIFVIECFGSQDCLRYQIVCGILEERGYELREAGQLTVTKAWDKILE